MVRLKLDGNNSSSLGTDLFLDLCCSFLEFSFENVAVVFSATYGRVSMQAWHKSTWNEAQSEVELAAVQLLCGALVAATFCSIFYI